MTKKLLECIGIDPARIRLEWISASEAPKFAQVVRDFVRRGKRHWVPNPLSHREDDRGGHTNLLKDINQIREGKTIKLITSIEHIPTICPYCGCGCGIYLVVKNGNMVGMEPWKDHPVCEGKNCQKGRNAHTFSTSDQRLKTPLIKKNGVFEETSWKAAFGLIADKLQNAEPDAVGFINSAKCSNEDLYVIQKVHPGGSEDKQHG